MLLGRYSNTPNCHYENKFLNRTLNKHDLTSLVHSDTITALYDDGFNIKNTCCTPGIMKLFHHFYTNW